jgi:hypothetical protein
MYYNLEIIMGEGKEEVTQKNNKVVVIDLLKEISGYEHSILKTILDLRNKPMEVVKAYNLQTKEYTNPFRLLLIGLSLWVFINTYLVDWYVIWGNYIQMVGEFSKSLMSMNERKIMKFDKIWRNWSIYNTKLLGDIFSKFFVPFVITAVIFSSILLTYICKKYRIDFKTHLVVLCYTTSTGLLLMLVLSVCFAINVWIGFLFLVFLTLCHLLGKSDWVSFSPVRNYFERDGISIERMYLLSSFVVNFILIVPVLLMYVYVFK